MRIYEGSPRQDFEEVLRSMGAYADDAGMREILILEIPDGFILQGLQVQASEGAWRDAMGRQAKETLRIGDDELSRFMDDGLARRGSGPGRTDGTPGYYERALRVIGRYIDEQSPRDVFLLEQDGAFVLRLLLAHQAGDRHAIVEFTKDDVEQRVAQGPSLREPQTGRVARTNGAQPQP
ncbi:MAG TPA: hypothetical protein VF802_03230 [Candidatus Limnocylindrales bacterium]